MVTNMHTYMIYHRADLLNLYVIVPRRTGSKDLVRWKSDQKLLFDRARLVYPGPSSYVYHF